MSRFKDLKINEKFRNSSKDNSKKSGKQKMIILAAIMLLILGVGGACSQKNEADGSKNSDTHTAQTIEKDMAQEADSIDDIADDSTESENKEKQTVNNDNDTVQTNDDSSETVDSTSIDGNTIVEDSNQDLATTDEGEVNGTATKEDAKETFKTNTNIRKPRKVKGIYVSGPKAGTKKYMDELIDLVDTTELNAMVIDIKNDSGEITYKMDLPEVIELEAGINYINDIKGLISKLKEKDIYLIARIVAFKDPVLAKGRPDLSLKKKDGSIFYDKSGLSWVNPYKKEVWDYLISIAKEAALLGFDEIQFDYIRFSTDTGMKEVDFGKDGKNKSKIDTITEFTKYAYENLKPLGVYVSADVYGTIIDSKVDAEIVGQDYKEMAKYLDYICPMIYPSHYQDGSYGIDHPDLYPYDLILKALEKSKEALGEEENDTAQVRSWLQDFTAKWLTHYKSYGAKEIRAQIQAVYDAGYEEWILWNGSNNYTKDGLERE